MTVQQLKRANEIADEIGILKKIKDNITYRNTGNNKDVFDTEYRALFIKNRQGNHVYLKENNENKDNLFIIKTFEKECKAFGVSIVKKIDSEIRKLEKEFESL